MDRESQRFCESLEGCISPPPESDMRIIGLNSFIDTKINFHRAYLETNWVMRAFAFTGVGILLMADIPVNGMM